MKPGAAVGETAVEMLRSGPDSGVFEGRKGAGRVVRGSRVTSQSHALWALKPGKGSHLHASRVQGDWSGYHCRSSGETWLWLGQRGRGAGWIP